MEVSYVLCMPILWQYNLSKAPCTACGYSGTKTAVFDTSYESIMRIPTTHKLWTSKFYHYVCTQDARCLCLLFLDYANADIYPYLENLKYRAINRLWDDIQDNPRDAEEIFPTKKVMQRINERNQREMAHRLRVEEQIRREQQLLNAYPDWFKAFEQKFAGVPIFVQSVPTFEDSGRTFRFVLKAIEASDKQNVSFDASQSSDIDITDSSVFRLNKAIKISCIGVKDAEDLVFRVLRSYAKAFADPNRLYFMTVL